METIEINGILCVKTTFGHGSVPTRKMAFHGGKLHQWWRVPYETAMGCWRKVEDIPEDEIHLIEGDL